MSLEQQISILKLFLEDVLYFSSNNNGEQKTLKHLKNPTHSKLLTARKMNINHINAHNIV